MTEEEKKILLKDLTARLSYGVKAKVNGHNNPITIYSIEKLAKSTWAWRKGTWIASLWNDTKTLENIKPYLRPMESMTEEEMGEYAKFKLSYDDVYEFTDFRATGKGFINVHTSCKNGGVGYTFQVNNRTMLYDGVIGIDWLNAHHFDYRGLIGMGLALEAPEGLYDGRINEIQFLRGEFDKGTIKNI